MMPSTARITRPTTPMAYRGRGWSKGITDQLSFPSISSSCPSPRKPLLAGVRLVGAQCRLLDDALEQLGIDRAIGRWRHGLAWFRQFGIAGKVEHRPRTAHLRDPGVERIGGHRLDDEVHVREAVAAEIRRKARKLAGPIRQEVQVGGHSPHRVNLT